MSVFTNSLYGFLQYGRMYCDVRPLFVLTRRRDAKTSHGSFWHRQFSTNTCGLDGTSMLARCHPSRWPGDATRQTQTTTSTAARTPRCNNVKVMLHVIIMHVSNNTRNNVKAILHVIIKIHVIITRDM